MKRTLFTLAALSIAIATTACGDGRSLATQDGGATHDAGVPVKDGPAPTPDVGPKDDRCVVAIRIDDCCTAAQPHRLREVLADPCLVLWPPQYPLEPSCLARRSPQCAAVDCAMGPPPSRRADEVNGECRFVDECASAEDCVLARDVRQCCGCEEGYPVDSIELQPCLLTERMARVPEACLPACTDALCAACLQAQGVICAMGDALNRCQAVWPD